MTKDPGRNGLTALAHGYVRFFRGAVGVVVGVAVLFALGSAIVYPLWLFATTSPAAYTAFVLAAIGTGVLGLGVRWFWKEARRSDRGIVAPLSALATMFGRVLAVAFILFGVYVAVLLFQVGRPAVAAAVSIAVLAALGLLFSGDRRRRPNAS